MEIKAILGVLGALLINLTLGTFYSIGNVIAYVASYMRENGNPDVTNEHGTWITATYLLGQGSFIIMGAFLEQKFNNRVACIFGCIIHCLSTFATIWALKVNILTVILIYGLGSGLGCGSAYVSSIIAVQKWFPQSKGIFTGIIVAGFGAGGLIFTTLQTLYMNPDNLPPDSRGYFEQSVYERVPRLFLYMGLTFSFVQAIGCALAFPPPAPPSNDQAHDHVNSAGRNPRSPTVIDEPVLPVLNSLWSAFGYKIFYCIAIMMMLVAPGVTFVNSLGKRYGQTYIRDDRFLATVVAVAAVANALGRLTWGFLMDKFAFSTCYTIKVLLFAILIALFPFGFILESESLYLIWMLGLFFGFSGNFVLFPVFIEQVFGVKYHGIIYGIMYIFLAVSSILTSLLIQKTLGPALESTGSTLTIRLIPCAVIATLYILSLVLYIFFIPVRRLENSIRRKAELEVAKTNNSLFVRQDLYPLERGTLAEKTAHKSNVGLPKENSLGSIVRIREIPDEKRIKTLANKA